ncbi:MAG: type-F conjugative transfer system secretin TraK [Nitrospiria bacterium]
MLFAIIFIVLGFKSAGVLAQEVQQDIKNPPGDVRLLPEVTTKVALSNSDVNRIICSLPITDIVYSKEKGLTVHYTKKDAYLKFEVVKENNKIIYASIPTEIYITCGTQVYHLIALPKRIPSRTIHLARGSSEAITANRSLFRGLPFEEKVLKLIKAVYTESIPNSFTIQSAKKPIKLFRNVSLTQIRTITVDGEGLDIKEYRITPKNTQAPLKLKEKDFLRSELTLRPVGITIDRLLLKPGETARMLIVERRGGPSHE